MLLCAAHHKLLAHGVEAEYAAALDPHGGHDEPAKRVRHSMCTKKFLSPILERVLRANRKESQETLSQNGPTFHLRVFESIFKSRKRLESVDGLSQQNREEKIRFD